jgi:Ribbon-helix-helix protein, copG family
MWPTVLVPGRKRRTTPGLAVDRDDIFEDMTDILIRDVPDEVVASLDAKAKSNGLTRAEYLRRLLADQQEPALTREQLNRFAERTADLRDPDVMAAAWR